MQLKTNKKEEAKMSKSIKVKKICNGNKESKDVLSQYLRIKELENSLNLYLKLETINSYKINVQIALLRFKNTVGYIKFVDRKYMKNFFNLKSIWLSNIDTFTKNSEEAADNLIDDKFEGKLEKLALDMPAFITSFTELDINSFDKNGFVKEEISCSLIKCEEKLGKNRDFIFIPYQNMIHLLNVIKECQAGKREGILKETTIFARKVSYITDYVNRMDKLEKDYFEGKKSVEQVGRGMLGTKSMKYSIQNEFRLGIVFPYKKSNYGNEAGTNLGIQPSFCFATQYFKKEELRSLNIEKLN